MAETATATKTPTTTAEPKPAAKMDKNGVHAAPGAITPDMAMAMVKVADLRPSPTNPRKFFDPGKLEELASSIRVYGVLQPVMVRIAPKGGQGYEIVAGERRYRAAKLAAVERIPAVVRQLSDEAVLEVQLIENHQRADTTELEEARGYRQLMAFDPKKHTAATIAGRIGKSEKYVWDRMKLCDLVPEAQEILDAGLMSAGHAILIARLKPEQQAKVLKKPGGGTYSSERDTGLWQDEDDGPHSPAEQSKRLIDVLDDSPAAAYKGLKAKSVRELNDWIENHVRFDPAHAAKASPHLFAEVKAKVDAAEAKPGRRKKWVYITHRHLADDSVRKDGGERVYGCQSWKRIKGAPCERAVLGVIGAGPVFNNERAFTVCVDRDCATHFKRARSAPRQKPPKAAPAGANEAERKKVAEQERKWQEQQRAQAAAREAFQKILPRLLDAVFIEIKSAPMAKLLPIAEENVEANSDLNLRAARKQLGVAKRASSAEQLVRLIAVERVCYELEAGMHGTCDSAEDLVQLFEPFGAGLPALAKKLQTSAPPAKAAAKKKPAKKKKAAKGSRGSHAD